MKKRTLFVGTLLMLFLGLIYAWSLFAVPLEETFNWNRNQTSMTFSISIITFCLGSIISSRILKKKQPGKVILTSAILFLIGFFSVTMIVDIWGLYISYGVLCGLGVGLSYNAILSTIPKWYGDKSGFATGILLMGMGLGGLFLGAVVKKLMDMLIWKTTFKILSITFFLLFSVGSFSISNPAIGRKENDIKKHFYDYTSSEMIKTKKFWAVFVWSTIVSAVGLGIVSNASYMVEEVGVTNNILPIVVGMISIGNGVGRLVFGKIVDKIGGKKAIYISNFILICGLILAIIANKSGILMFLVMGLTLGGIAYGSAPMLSAASTKMNFGEKHLAENLSVMVLGLIPASLIGPTISASIYRQSGSYFASYLIMFVIALLAFLPAKIYNEG